MAKNDVWRVTELRNGVRFARKEMEKEAKVKGYFKRKKTTSIHVRLMQIKIGIARTIGRF